MKRFLIAAVALMTAVMPAYCEHTGYDGSLGSAGTPDGTTLVVSVFASDQRYSWDFSREEDVESRENILDYLGIATDYLCTAVVSYGKEATFIYDFETYDDLYYEADLDTDTTNNDYELIEMCMCEFLDEYVDSDALLEKYNADNIIYFMLINSDAENQAITCTRNYYEGMEYPYEIVFLYNVDEGAVNCPAVYAHEMMHTFGAPDLYYANTEYGITPEFLEYVQENMQNDLMFNCSDLETGSYQYDQITNELSEVDAYYAGLTDQCDLVDEFDLIPSQHLTAK